MKNLFVKPTMRLLSALVALLICGTLIYLATFILPMMFFTNPIVAVFLYIATVLVIIFWQPFKKREKPNEANFFITASHRGKENRMNDVLKKYKYSKSYTGLIKFFAVICILINVVSLFFSFIYLYVGHNILFYRHLLNKFGLEVYSTFVPISLSLMSCAMLVIAINNILCMIACVLLFRAMLKVERLKQLTYRKSTPTSQPSDKGAEE